MQHNHFSIQLSKALLCKFLTPLFCCVYEDILNDIRALTQQLKLKDLIIACSIPPKYQEKIMEHCKFNEYEGVWMIEHVGLSGSLYCNKNFIPTGYCVQKQILLFCPLVLFAFHAYSHGFCQGGMPSMQVMQFAPRMKCLSNCSQ